MESRPATMAKASRAGAPATCSCLPEEITTWEILVRLPPKSLLRCRAVCRTWRRVTCARDFLLAHHARQCSLPIVSGVLVPGSEYGGARYEDILAFNHRAAGAQLQPVARLDTSFFVESSCDGLLVLSKRSKSVTCLSVCNPVTREHAPLVDFTYLCLLGMYLHRPTGEYRLLLHRRSQTTVSIAGTLLPNSKIGCYIFAPGSDQPPRYIQGPEGRGAAAAVLRVSTPSWARDNLHWFPMQRQSESRPIFVFDTTSESFRQMVAPLVRPKSNIFEMDDTLGIYSYRHATEVVYIWMLQNYEREVWKFKYRVELPVAKIRGQFGRREGSLYVGVVSADGDVLLLLSHGGWIFYVNTDGELVDSFHRDGQHIYAWDLRFKQSLVPHNFFTALDDFSVDASPFL